MFCCFMGLLDLPLFCCLSETSESLSEASSDSLSEAFSDSVSVSDSSNSWSLPELLLLLSPFLAILFEDSRSLLACCAFCPRLLFALLAGALTGGRGDLLGPYRNRSGQCSYLGLREVPRLTVGGKGLSFGKGSLALD